MRKASRFWELTTTMEKLATSDYACGGAVLKYDEQVLAVCLDGFDYHAAVFEFIETPEETGLDETECRLNMVETTMEAFADGGHAMAWCLAHI